MDLAGGVADKKMERIRVAAVGPDAQMQIESRNVGGIYTKL